jgi:hypothetical protein
VRPLTFYFSLVLDRNFIPISVVLLVAQGTLPPSPRPALLDIVPCFFLTVEKKRNQNHNYHQRPGSHGQAASILNMHSMDPWII